MVETEHPYYVRNRELLIKIRDICSGNVKKLKYLPKIDNFDTIDYQNLLKITHLFPATQRTLQAFVGMIFRKSPIVTCSDQLKEILDDLDYEKCDFESLVYNIVYNICQVGNHCCFLDYPVSNNPRSKLESEKALPIIRDIPIESVINWQYNSNQLLEFVVLKVDYLKRVEFQHEIVECYIVLELKDNIYNKTIYTKDSTGNWIIESGTPKIKGSTLDFIPFYTYRHLDKPIDSILLPLVDANLSHFVLSAFKDNYLLKICLPTPYLFGNVELPTNNLGQKYLPIGPHSAIISSNTDTKIGFLSYDGAGIEAISNTLKDIRDVMAALGSRALASERRQVETAEVAKIHRIGEHATLAGVVVRCNSFIKNILTNIATWVFTEEEISYELTTDFIPENIDGSLLTAIINAWMNNAISLENVFTFLQQSEFLEREINFKDFLKKLEEEKSKKDEIDSVKREEELLILQQQNVNNPNQPNNQVNNPNQPNTKKVK